uniref:Uncharacterized protein n=1 Tax=Romanomermis culicivorax TaxID=13658 RepID=A0A915I8B1_ROMCU
MNLIAQPMPPIHGKPILEPVRTISVASAIGDRPNEAQTTPAACETIFMK